MTDIMRRWVNDEVGLSSRVEDLERDFATGYAFGELLSKHNMQPDFDKFERNSRPDSLISNFTRLQPTFARLGLKLDSRTANAVLREEKGVAAQLLYGLKQALEAATIDVQKVARVPGKTSSTLGIKASLNRTLLEAQQCRSEKKTHDSQQLQRFEELMRLHASNPKALRQSLHLQPFQQAGEALEQSAARAEAREAAAKAGERAAFRTSRMSHKRQVEQDAKAFMQRVAKVHTAAQKHKHQLEAQDLRVELTLAKKDEARRRMQQEAAALDAVRSIEALEVNLRRVASGEAAGAQEALPPIGKTPFDHMNRIKQFLPEKAKMKQEVEAYMERNRVKRASDIDARKERQARRRQLVIEQQASAEAMERKSKVDGILTALNKRSQEEQRIAERLAQLEREANVFASNRALREAQYQERREKNWEEALTRENEVARSMKERLAEEAEKERKILHKALAQRERASREKHLQLVKDVVSDLISLSLRCAEYRGETDRPVPRKEYRDWMALFLKADASLSDALVQTEAAAVAVDPVVDAAALEDLLATCGEWSQPEEVGFNAALGEVVHGIHARLHAPPPVDPMALVVPFRVAVVGAPFTGKSTLAKRLAELHRAVVLDPETLAAAAIKAADDYEDPVPEVPVDQGQETVEAEDGALSVPPPPRQVVLGRRAKELLLDGDVLSDADAVLLVIDAVAALQDKFLAWKADHPGEQLDGSVPQGFVLDGFPRTVAQAQLFEREITALDLQAEKVYQDSASRICPPPGDAFESLDRPLRSCLDAVVILTLESSDIAIERALGRRMDPETGIKYHLSFNPPPLGIPGLIERLVPVQDPSNNSEQIHERLEAYFDTAEPLHRWLWRFEKLARSIDSNVSLEELTAAVESVTKTLETCKSAAAAGERARDAAQQAQRDAEVAASSAAEAAAAAAAAAKELLNAKKAEVEAAALLKPPTPDDPKAGKRPAKGAAEAAAQAEEAERAAAAAIELLKTEAAAKCAAQLKAGEAASREAQAQAAVAQECADAARQALLTAQRLMHDAEACVEAETNAARAAASAAAAATAAAAAAQRAAGSRDAALAAVAEAQSKLAAPPADGGAAPGVSAPDASDPEGQVQDTPAALPTALDDSMVAYLGEVWQYLEQAYLTSMTRTFAAVRAQRAAIVQHGSDTVGRLATFLQREDGKQVEVTRFQARFNEVDLDMRRLPDTKAELMLWADEVRDALWAICDQKQQENGRVCAELATPEFAADHLELLSEHFVSFLQLEADRFVATAAFIRDYVCGVCGITPPDQPPRLPDLSKPDEDVRALLDPKSGVELPDWCRGAAKLPSVQRAAAACCAIVAQQQRALGFGAGGDEARGRKAGGKQSAEEALGLQATPEALEAARALASKLMRREEEIMKKRVRMMLQRSEVHANEVSDALERCAARLQGMVKRRYIAECETVASFAQLVKDAVHDERTLSLDLRIVENKLIVDSSSILIPVPHEHKPLPPKEKSKEAGLLNCEQIAALVAALASGMLDASGNEFIATRDLADIILKLASATGAGAFPAIWGAATYKQVRDALARFDPHHSSFVDHLEVVSSLIVQSFSSIGTAGAAQFATAARKLAAADRDNDGAVSYDEWMACTLWFQVGQKLPGCSDDLEADFAMTHESLAREPFDEAAALKRLLWDMFSQEARGGEDAEAGTAQEGAVDRSGAAAASGESGEGAAPLGASKRIPDIMLRPAASANEQAAGRLLSYQRMLLYMAADVDQVAGLRKAFAVVTNDASTKARANVEQLEALFYPSGAHAGKDIFKVPYGRDQIQAMVSDIYLSRGGAADTQPTVTVDHLTYSSAGSKLVAACCGRYHLRDLFLDFWRVQPSDN